MGFGLITSFGGCIAYRARKSPCDQACPHSAWSPVTHPQSGHPGVSLHLQLSSAPLMPWLDRASLILCLCLLFLSSQTLSSPSSSFLCFQTPGRPQRFSALVTCSVQPLPALEVTTPSSATAEYLPVVWPQPWIVVVYTCLSTTQGSPWAKGSCCIHFFLIPSLYLTCILVSSKEGRRGISVGMSVTMLLNCGLTYE